MTSGSAPRSVTVRVPAKVNVELRVGPQRADGYHDLSTVFMAVGIHDHVTVSRSEDQTITTTGPYADRVPDTQDNLALQAARLIAQRGGVSDSGCRIEIAKEIPVAGGMAGGSADAAATLVACDHLWRIGMERDELAEIAAELGSDVPFLLSGGVAVGSGRGEHLAPALSRGPFHWVFAVSDAGLSTPEVYRELDRQRAGSAEPVRPPAPDLMAALRAGDADGLARAMGNDLQDAAVALRPDLSDIIDAGMQVGALAAIVSGSGPTVAMLARSPEHALDLAVSLTAAQVATEIKRAKGPVPGAQVVSGPML